MERIWQITAFKMKGGYRVCIEGNGKWVRGDGKTLHLAYKAAEYKLVIKPWLESNES